MKSSQDNEATGVPKLLTGSASFNSRVQTTDRRFGVRVFRVMWIPGHENRIPVGVLQADASLLEFVCVLQLGHFLGVDGRFGHGLLEVEVASAF